MSRYAQWYVIAWRLLWAPLIFPTLILLIVLTAIAYGRQNAMGLWRWAR